MPLDCLDTVRFAQNGHVYGHICTKMGYHHL
jgi:hypothetical protein